MRKQTQTGFTIIELLIVIVIIAILAAITIVAYSGITANAKLTALKSTLDSANSAVDASIITANALQPTGFPSSLQLTSPNIVLELTVPSSTSQPGYCINGYSTDLNTVWSYTSDGTLSQSMCPYYTVVGTLGGSVPNPPAGVNLVADFPYWTQGGPTTTASFDSNNDQFVVNSNTGSVATFTSSPIRVTNARLVQFWMSAYATTAASSFTPSGGVYVGIHYYAADCATPVNNPYYQPANNYTGNGWAYGISPLNQWVTTPSTSAFPLKQSSGSPSVVQCVTFTIQAGGSSTYTANGTMTKNFKVTVTY